MKKIVFSLLLITALVLSSCTSDIAKSGGVVVRGNAPPTANIAECYKREDVVYITKSGTKYHKDGCPYLKSTKIPVSLEQAEMMGLTPCSKCFKDES